MATDNQMASLPTPTQDTWLEKGYNKCYKCKTNFIEKPRRVCDACKAGTIQRRVSNQGGVSQTKGPGPSICKDCGKRPALGAGVNCCAACQVARENHDTEKASGRHEEWEAQGLCKRCGRQPPAANNKNCKECKERNEKSWRKMWSRRDGDCKLCGMAMPEGDTRIYCADCRARANRRMKARSDNARKAGMCVRCTRRPMSPGRVTCDPCYEYVRSYQQTRHGRIERGRGRKQIADAPNPDQALPEVDQEGGEEDVQDSEEQDHMEMDLGDTDMIDEMVLGNGINRMAIDYIVN
ncbi:hypothetical protein PG991_002925 [Apiospora marii]|uniref:Stc1 domain-containing protein n=1 Tax=Apiospora marii TaxID=335849 RepID=A0ABR1SGR8_9PEZI